MDVLGSINSLRVVGGCPTFWDILGDIFTSR